MEVSKLVKKSTQHPKSRWPCSPVPEMPTKENLLVRKGIGSIHAPAQRRRRRIGPRLYEPHPKYWLVVSVVANPYNREQAHQRGTNLRDKLWSGLFWSGLGSSSVGSLAVAYVSFGRHSSKSRYQAAGSEAKAKIRRFAECDQKSRLLPPPRLLLPIQSSLPSLEHCSLPDQQRIFPFRNSMVFRREVSCDPRKFDEKGESAPTGCDEHVLRGGGSLGTRYRAGNRWTAHVS